MSVASPGTRAEGRGFSHEAVTDSRGMEINEVSVRFGNGSMSVLALDRCSLRIARGERIALLGPSGCGKSTLLRVVADLLPATGGTVSVPGPAWSAWLSAHPCPGLSTMTPRLHE